MVEFLKLGCGVRAQVRAANGLLAWPLYDVVQLRTTANPIQSFDELVLNQFKHKKYTRSNRERESRPPEARGTA